MISESWYPELLQRLFEVTICDLKDETIEAFLEN